MSADPSYLISDLRGLRVGCETLLRSSDETEELRQVTERFRGLIHEAIDELRFELQAANQRAGFPALKGDE